MVPILYFTNHTTYYILLTKRVNLYLWKKWSLSKSESHSVRKEKFNFEATVQCCTEFSEIWTVTEKPYNLVEKTPKFIFPQEDKLLLKLEKERNILVD